MTVRTPEPRLEKLWSVREPMLVIVPEKVVLVLSPPTLRPRCVPSFQTMVPAPASEPMASPPPVSSQKAPDWTMTGTVSATLSAPLEIRRPAATVNGPVKVLAPVIVSVPAPFLVRPPEPLKTLAKVTLLAVAGILTKATPPSRAIPWLLAVVALAKVAPEAPA